MDRVNFQRLFSLSAFECLRAVKIKLAEDPNMVLDDVIGTIKATNPDSRSMDFEAVAELLDIIDDNVSPDQIDFYQECIKCVIINRQPVWARLMTLGRRRFTSKLDRDEKNIFRVAGLLEDKLDEELVLWWDYTASQVRLENDQKKMEQARQAERLTLDYERKKLIEQGISKEPVWTAIEDNTAGYDVLSYTQGEYGLINRLIEVKSTVASPLRFYVTKNEWNHALKLSESYTFYVWDMKQSPPVLHKKTVSDIEPHIPRDTGKGSWKTAEIPIGV